MNDAAVIERLTHTAKKDAARMHRVGLHFGRRWAKTSATSPELKRLERAATSNWDGDEAYVRLYSEVWPFGSPTPADVEVFWQCALACNDIRITLENGFIAGFAEGALQVWRRLSAGVRSAA